jgi:hypothetical protein
VILPFISFICLNKTTSRDLTETITTLAHVSRFIISDATKAKSGPQELTSFEHFKRFPWIFPIYKYVDKARRIYSLKKYVIELAEIKAQELAIRYSVGG